MLRKLAIALCLIAAGASTGRAMPVYGTPADLTGARTQDDLVLGGNYSGDNVSISWAITDLGGGSWHYLYTFTGFGQPDISHIILDLSDDAVLPLSGGDPADPDVVTDVSTNAGQVGDVEFGAYGPGPSNPGFPSGAEIVGVKFNFSGSSPLTVEFDSNRSPVWGDVYLKGGSSSFAYNPGLADHDSTDVLDFIARPNGVVPEPSGLVTLGIGVVGLLGYTWRRRLLASR